MLIFKEINIETDNKHQINNNKHGLAHDSEVMTNIHLMQKN